MASSRQMRGRRVPSPFDGHTQSPASLEGDLVAEPVENPEDSAWVEPPLRAPAPSFEDYKGLERHGVLEHMAPLGHPPGQKLKTKLKHQEAIRRAGHVKSGENRLGKEAVNVPEPSSTVVSRRYEPRQQRGTTKTSSGERAGERSYETRTAETRSSRRDTTMSSDPIQPTANGGFASHAIHGNDALADIVEQACVRATEVGNASLGPAIRKLYEESLSDQRVRDLLNAVLTKAPTAEQAADFQRHVKEAKRKLKHNRRNSLKQVSPSEPVSQSPGKVTKAKFPTQRSSAFVDTSESNHVPILNSKRPLMDQTKKRAAINGRSPAKDERSAKRLKRSNSASSGSSLSDLGSGIDEFAPEDFDANAAAATSGGQLPPQRAFQTRPKSGNLARPKGASWTANKSLALNSQRRGSQITDEMTVDQIAEKKLHLSKSNNFAGYNVLNSNVRPPPRSDLKATGTKAPPDTYPSHRSLDYDRMKGDTLYHGEVEDDDDALSSPPSSPGTPFIPPPFGMSRGDTPDKFPRPKAKIARIKMSPIKRRAGVTAGIARGAETEGLSQGHRRSDDNQEGHPINSDVCAACSGSGKLLLCDGCDRAFHLTCVEPPLDPDHNPEGEWYCSRCTVKHKGSTVSERGLFQKIDAGIQRKNASAFFLPSKIRGYFDGVKTGEEGEYEESTALKANKSRIGHDEKPDGLKLQDTKGNAILCFRCGKSSFGRKEMAECDFCNCFWHLDCLDPPLANPPSKKSLNGKPRQTWMCPNHVDDALAHLSPSLRPIFHDESSLRIPTQRFYKVRRPRNPTTIDASLRRGFRNNGLIDIGNETEEEEEEIEREIGGAIYRVPEKGIKLDFIDRVRRMNEADDLRRQNLLIAQQKAAQRDQVTQTSASIAFVSDPIDERPFVERQAALNLAQLAQLDGVFTVDKVKQLIQVLTAEAPSEVEKLFVAAEKAGSVFYDHGPTNPVSVTDARQIASTEERSVSRSPEPAATAGSEAPLPSERLSTPKRAVDSAQLIPSAPAEDGKAPQDVVAPKSGKDVAMEHDSVSGCETRKPLENGLSSLPNDILHLGDVDASASKKRKISEDDIPACDNATASRDEGTSSPKKLEILEEPPMSLQEDASVMKKVNEAASEVRAKSDATTLHIPAVSEGTEDTKDATFSLAIPSLSKDQSPEVTTRDGSTSTPGKAIEGSNAVPAPEEGCIGMKPESSHRQRTATPILQANKNAFPGNSTHSPARGISEQERKDLEALIKLAQRRLLWGHSMRHD